MQSRREAFVRIDTLFEGEADRTIGGLRAYYTDSERLRKAVERIAAPVLTPAVISGKRLLLKPNWVKHPSFPEDECCLHTHHSFTLAVLAYVLQLQPASVVLGDAPIQGCRWNEVVTPAFTREVQSLAAQYRVPVTVQDFRRVIFDPVNNQQELEKNPLSAYVLFDVGSRSYLEPITKADKNQFRVSQYNPDRFRESHQPGMHRYCITRELFEADVVISLPKIKTHQKSGITNALKNIVGLNGDKDFLPHHRIGGSKAGGDSYQGRNLLRYWSELALDQANRRKGKKGYTAWRRFSSLLWKLSLPDKRVHRLNGAWYGNDTTWRMVMDLNLVMHYGTADGQLQHEPVRRLFHFCDGIIAGQGDGPLRPEPLPLGVLMLSDHAALADQCAALLMGMRTEKVPLLRAAEAWLTDTTCSVQLNGREVTAEKLRAISLNARMPPGWQAYAE